MRCKLSKARSYSFRSPNSAKCCLTSQWSGRLRAAHSGAAHRRVIRRRVKRERRAACEWHRVELKSCILLPPVRACSVGERRPSLRKLGNQNRACCGRQSPREALEPKARAGQWSGSVRCSPCLVVHPRGFYGRDTLSVPDKQATELLCAQSVSERAALKRSVMQTPRPMYNQLVERTPPRCALQRRSPAR